MPGRWRRWESGTARHRDICSLTNRPSYAGGRVPAEATTELVRPVVNPREMAFSGIHVVSPRLLPMLTDPGAFSIIDAYLRLAGRGQRIVGFRADEYSWRDVGTPAELELARRERAD